MTDLFADMTADAVSAIAQAGETASVIYTPSGSSGITIDVVRTDNVEAIGENGQVLHLGTVFDIARADVDRPGQGDKITIGSTSWIVQEIVERDQYMTRVTIRG